MTDHFSFSDEIFSNKPTEDLLDFEENSPVDREYDNLRVLFDLVEDLEVYTRLTCDNSNNNCER